MNKGKAILDRIRGRLPLVVFVLCVIQPLLDAAGYWQQYFGVSNAVTMALRMILLGGTVLLGFVLSDRKRYYFLTAAVLAALTAGHIFACTRSVNGYQEPIKDLINLVRIYFLPLMTVSFITFLRKNEDVFPALIRGMVTDLFLIEFMVGLYTLIAIFFHSPHDGFAGIWRFPYVHKI